MSDDIETVREALESWVPGLTRKSPLAALGRIEKRMAMMQGALGRIEKRMAMMQGANESRHLKYRQMKAERDTLANALRRAEGMIAIAQEEQMAAKARAWDRLQGLDLESSPDVKGLMADVLAEETAGDADASKQGAK